MLHVVNGTIESQLLYIHRAQTHDFVANGTRVSNYGNRIRVQGVD